MTENQLSSTMSIQEDVLKLRVENKQLKAQIEKMKNHQNCKYRKTWDIADIMDDGLKKPCDKCKDFDKWELADE